MRPQAYQDRIGTVDTKREVQLYRVDTNRKYTPTAEAYEIPTLTTNLESDKHGVSSVNSVAVRFIRTNALVDFLDGLNDRKNLRIAVYGYHLFYETEKYPLWYGVLERLPEGSAEYPVEKIDLTFISFMGIAPDGDSVKNHDTNDWYINKHLTDVILPALLQRAAQDTGITFDLTAPALKGAAPFWSGIDRPKKKLAAAATYDDTCRATALCWDGSLLYIGVHDAQGSATLPWVISYNPTTRKWRKITVIKYAGAKPELKPPTEWEVQHLEYAAGTIRLVARTNHPNLLDAQAHYHCRASFAVAAPPIFVELQDANLFTLHDRGQCIRSANKTFDNRDWAGNPPHIDGVDYYADLQYHGIGWATARHTVKECSTLFLAPKRSASLLTGTYISYGAKVIRIQKDADKKKHPRVGDYIEGVETTIDYRQSFGRVLAIKDAGDYFELSVSLPSRYFGYAPLSVWKIFLFADEDCPEDNVFIAEPQEISLTFLFPADIAGQDSEPVVVERCRSREGFVDFYWPQIILEAGEDGKQLIDEVGYIALSSVRDLEVVDQNNPTTFVKYEAGDTAPFDITLAGYNPAFLLSRNLWVASALQNGSNAQPGKCRLIYNGATAKLTSGEELTTYGNIYLWDDDGQVYVAWNDHKTDDGGVWYSQCKLGRWTGTAVNLLWTDRAANWRSLPECYIKSMARFGGNSYFGRRYYERNWVNTNLRVYRAIPPQSDISPRQYAGGYVGLIVLQGDKSEVIADGDIIRLRYKTSLSVKDYRVADVQVLTRIFSAGLYISPGLYEKLLAGGYIDSFNTNAYTGTITAFTLISIDPIPKGWTYADAVAAECLGRYITVAIGRDERAQIARGTPWAVVYTATSYAEEPVEGQEAAYNAERWRGETKTIVYDANYDRMPRIALDHLQALAGNIVVTLKDTNRILDVEDLTTDVDSQWYQSFPIPPAYKCYVHRRQGEARNETWVWFNPSLEGKEINIDYNYYVAGAAFTKPVRTDNFLAFNESGPRHRFVKSLNGSAWTVDYSPRVGDAELAVVINAGDDLYAISAPSYLLVHYGLDWTGYITVAVNGLNNPIWGLIGALARGADMYCWEELGKLYLYNRNGYNDRALFAPTDKNFRQPMTIAEAAVMPYKRVQLSYANGTVERGDGKPILNLAAPFIFDKGHAEAVLAGLYTYYNSHRREFNILCNGIQDNVEVLTDKIFPYHEEKVHAVIIGRDYNPDNTTLFRLSELTRQPLGA